MLTQSSILDPRSSNDRPHARTSTPRGGAWIVVLLLIACTGCDTEGEPARPTASGHAAASGASSLGYTVYLQGAVTDTLQGPASFGVVVGGEHSRRHFVIALESEYDIAGGFFLVRGRPERPAPGTYTLAPPDSGAYDAFGLIYREGMQLHLRATSGMLTLTTVSDTLIEGTFEAALRGYLIRSGERLPEARVNARGTFRARPDDVGFVVGL